VLFYYQFNIGDYLKHTAHLSPLEDIAYRRLLDIYYDTETPIPTDIPRVSRRLRIDPDTIKLVLDEFFEYTDSGYRNKRADGEIAAYHAFLEKQKANGIKGGRPKTKPTANPPLTQAEPKITLTTNREPLTVNQSKIKNTGAEAPAWLPASWQTYTQHRKESRKPLTATAQTAAINKLERWKAEGKDIAAIITQSVENGWSGLFEVKQGVGQGKPSIAPPKLSCCVCKGVLKGFVETQSGKMCSTCWDKR
jgi:uncharacterized protein YdaU (DUF1376 family)